MNNKTKKVVLSSLYRESKKEENGAKIERTYQLPEDIYHEDPLVKKIIDKKRNGD